MMDRKIRVLTIFGTRPEAIKMAPLVKELESRENIESVVCVTAQHRQMLDQVLAETAAYDYDAFTADDVRHALRQERKSLRPFSNHSNRCLSPPAGPNMPSLFHP